MIKNTYLCCYLGTELHANDLQNTSNATYCGMYKLHTPSALPIFLDKDKDTDKLSNFSEHLTYNRFVYILKFECEIMLPITLYLLHDLFCSTGHFQFMKLKLTICLTPLSKLLVADTLKYEQFIGEIMTQ